MRKWVWITVPAVAVGLGLVFLGGSAFAQNAGGTSTSGVNWTAMHDYCRNIMTGNPTLTDNDFSQMQGYCQDATVTGSFSQGGMMGNSGMMGGGRGMMGDLSSGRGMMGW